MSRNIQRYSTLPKNLKSNNYSHKSDYYNVDFSETIENTQEYIKGILYVCLKCGKSTNITIEEILKKFRKETKNHVLYSVFKNEKCNICKKNDNKVYFLRIKNNKYDDNIRQYYRDIDIDTEREEIMRKLQDGDLYEILRRSSGNMQKNKFMVWLSR